MVLLCATGVCGAGAAPARAESASGPAQTATHGFIDVTGAVGLRYDAGDDDAPMLDGMGYENGGLAFGDIDNDGGFELYVAHGQNGGGRLFGFDGRRFAPLARIRERRNVLGYRDTVARTVESVIGAWRNMFRAYRAIAISGESLARAKNQIEVNRALIRGGRMAAREIIQTEAEVANRELALVESENRLSVANAALISILKAHGRIPGGGGDLRDAGLPRPLVDQDSVGEGPADVDSQPVAICHVGACPGLVAVPGPLHPRAAVR